jgi:aminoglycoside phosphotransferase (APT) family kinase protein
MAGMLSEEVVTVAGALGREVVATRTLAGGFSHETCLLTLDEGQVVARMGGGDPAIEAAVMGVAAEHAPVPRVLALCPAAGGQARPVMVLDYVSGVPLSEVLDGPADASLEELGAEVGRVVAGIGMATFERPGFFTGPDLTVGPMPRWSEQLPRLVADWLEKVPAERLDPTACKAWLQLCTAHAPALTRVDDQARLAHGDINPKNILVARNNSGWRVTSVLDWEFAYSGCPYSDAANMLRFGADYPPSFSAGFRTGFAAQPATPPLPADWLHLGRVLDMFALTDLLTRPIGHPIADQAATQIRRWLEYGVPN